MLNDVIDGLSKREVEDLTLTLDALSLKTVVYFSNLVISALYQ